MRHGGYILGTNFFGSVFKKNPLLQNCIMLELFYFQEIRIYIDSSAPNLKSLLQFFVAIYKFKELYRARNIRLLQDLDWIGEIYNGREFFVCPTN